MLSLLERLGSLIEVENVGHLKPIKKRFLRVKVLMNLHLPLTPGLNHHRPPKPPAWIQFKLERLSNFCYGCGRLGHLLSYCPVDPLPSSNLRYGPQLKASAPYSNRAEELAKLLPGLTPIPKIPILIPLPIPQLWKIPWSLVLSIASELGELRRRFLN